MNLFSNLAVCVGLYIMCLIQVSLQDKEGLEVSFYRMKLEEWNEKDHATKLQDLMASESDKFCSVHPADCGLTHWNDTFKFTRGDVIIAGGYPKEDGDLKLIFYIFSNFSSSINLGYTLNKPATRVIFLEIKERLEAALDTYVTNIGEEFYGIPPDHQANRIIIPIAFCVLLIIILITIGLAVWSKKKERERNKQHLKKSKHISTKESPAHHTSSNWSQVKNTGEDNHNQDTENKLMNDNKNYLEPKLMESKHMSPVTNSNSHSSLNEFNDDSSYINETIRKRNELPPLNAEETDPEMTKQKRKRKVRKKKKRDREGYDNSGIDESETETFNHTITNVEPNNVIAEETVM